MITLEDIIDIKTKLNSACDLLEDVLGDYEEIKDAMDNINDTIGFLYILQKEYERK